MAIDFSAPVYQFTMLDADGKEVSLEKYRFSLDLIRNSVDKHEEGDTECMI